MVKIHYFFDPMCGWCYGASPLIKIIHNSLAMELVYHPGGMRKATPIPAEFRQTVLVSDKKIAELTGASFGEAYIKRVNSHDEMVLDSYITAQAILAANIVGIGSQTMLESIQSAHYQHGLKTNEPEVIQQLSRGLGVQSEQWLESMSTARERLVPTIEQTQMLMAKHGVAGYPTLFVEKDGAWQRLNHTAHYGKPEEWKRYLIELTNQ